MAIPAVIKALVGKQGFKQESFSAVGKNNRVYPFIFLRASAML
jgi:hypothetical protein